MSNYPPPPPFGGGQFFPPGPIPFPPPPPNVNYPNYPPYPQQPNHQQAYPQGLPNGQAAQYTNAAAFSQNQFQHMPPHPNFYNYYANNPPAAYPQGQIHSPTPATTYAATLQQYSGQIFEQRPSSNTPGVHTNLDASQGQLWSRPPDATDEAINRALSAAKSPSDLYLPHAASALKTANQPSISERGSAGAGLTLDDGGDAPMQLDSSVAETFQESGKGPPPLPYSQPEQLPTLSVIPPRNSNTTHVANMPETSHPSLAGQPLPLRLWQEKRAQAKVALSQMLRGGITLGQISQEGVNMLLLRELAAEIGQLDVWASLKEPLNARSSRSLESGEVSEGDSQLDTQLTNGLDDASLAQPTSAKNDAAVSSQPSKELATIKKGEERKDYIARLLAAKQSMVKDSRKSIPIVDGPSSSKLTPVELATAPSTKQDIDQPQPQAQFKRPEAKDPVQTELVRKRLEALKAANRPSPIQTLATQVQSEQVQPTAELMGQGRSDPPQDRQESQQSYLGGPASGHRSAGLDSSLTYTPRSNSFYADGDQQDFSGLPGLSPVLIRAPPYGEQRFLQRSDPIESSTKLHKFGQDNAMFESGVASNMRMDVASREDTYPDQMDQPEPDSAPAQPSKRARASDFIDSPPPKRRTSSGRPIELVIDVSDDEEGEISAEAAAQEFLSRTSAAEISALRNKPPLSSYHSADPPGTPRQAPQTPTKLTELEAEMKAMKEKIAARQRHRQAQRTNEMPGSMGDSSCASNSGIASPGIVGSIQVLDDGELKAKQKQQQQRSFALSRSLLQEKLEAERRHHAQFTAYAEKEKLQAAGATTEAEREKHIDRKDMLEASISKLDVSIEATVQRMEAVRRQEREIQEQLEQGKRERQALLDQLDLILESEQQKASLAVPEERDASQQLAERSLSADQNPTPDGANGIQQGDSSAQSSADLPEYNRKTPQTISSRAQSAENLLEDAMDISGASDDGLHRSSREKSEIDSLFETKPRDNRLGELRAEDDAPTGTTSRDETAAQDDYGVSLDEQFSDDDNGEDINSGSPMELQDIYPEQSSHSSSRSNEAGESGESVNGDDAMPETYPEETTYTSIHPAQHNKVSSVSPRNGEGTISLADPTRGQLQPADHISEEGEISDDEMSASDDYEPPEPAVDDVSEPEEPVSISQNGLQPSVAAVEVGMEKVRDDVVGGEAVQPESTGVPPSEHFQPYESPLTRFKSYRYHPQYVATVSGGFKSLTFSHNIRPNQPLCRWETAGGRCNDAACTSQHFCDLPLTGNALLLQLDAGATDSADSTTEQNDAYKHGLRALLAEQQVQGVTDVEHVAQTIVAYRARFLGDASRVVAFPAENGGT